MSELIEIFFNVITPVFALVLIGYLGGPRLGLEARTLSRTAYFILIPAFVFNVMSTADVEAGLAARMIGYIVLVHVVLALIALLVGVLLKRPSPMISAYIVIAVFGNVGNFGLPLIEFRLGTAALVPATVYFLAISSTAFVISVAAASWHRGGRLQAMLSVAKTPALIALPPALLLNGLNVTLPLFVSRIVGLLAAAMIPIMLVTLGVQLAAMHDWQINHDMIIATGLRLLAGPAVAILLVRFFDLSGIERGAGILQASMPTAVLASIIALENDLMPDFVTTTVLFSILASIVTLTLLLLFI